MEEKGTVPGEEVHGEEVWSGAAEGHFLGTLGSTYIQPEETLSSIAHNDPGTLFGASLSAHLSEFPGLSSFWIN